ncbi:MAG: ribonuclease P protein component [Beijerinckiaceae bacterium]
MIDFGTLTRRSEFTAVRKGRRAETAGFTIQAIRRKGDEATRPRFGLTVTKKTGNAVVRNRIKRRLRALLRALPDGAAGPACDHVLFVRRDALHTPFAAMLAETQAALTTLDARLSRHAPPLKTPSNPDRADRP